MMKMSEYRQCGKTRVVILLVKLAIAVSLCGQLAPDRSLFAQEEAVDTLAESVAGGSQEETGQPDGADEIVTKKTSCLCIIREDYDGKRLRYPSNIFFDPVKREIYVNDSGHSRILVYTHDFYPLLSIGKSIDELHGIEAPAGMAVDPKGWLFVAQSPGREHPRARISVFNPCLRWKRDIFFTGFEGADNFRPQNIAINKQGILYVAGGYCGVVVLNKDGTFSHFLSPMDSLGKKEEQKASICDVEIDNDGRIYLLSQDMGRIYVYDEKESFLFKFGKKGGTPGKLSRPHGMAVDDRNKRIYVIDYMRHTASAYSIDGRFLFEFGGKGVGRGWFQYPRDINVDTSGNVLVADTFNHRVQVIEVL